MRYEDVESCLGDDPQDRSLFVREPHAPDDHPTKAECDRDEAEIAALRATVSVVPSMDPVAELMAAVDAARSWPRAQYSDGAL